MADKLIVDCSGGDVSREAWTDADEADRQQAAQELRAAEDARAAEEQAWRDAIRNASTLADLKAVLAGDAGVGQADHRRPS